MAETTAGARVEVRRGKNESTTALIRRFTRRVQGLGLVRAVRNGRYWERPMSKNVERKRAIISKVREARQDRSCRQKDSQALKNVQSKC